MVALSKVKKKELLERIIGHIMLIPISVTVINVSPGITVGMHVCFPVATVHITGCNNQTQVTVIAKPLDGIARLPYKNGDR